jgi:hypothetical protein
MQQTAVKYRFLVISVVVQNVHEFHVHTGTYLMYTQLLI